LNNIGGLGPSQINGGWCLQAGQGRPYPSRSHSREACAPRRRGSGNPLRSLQKCATQALDSRYRGNDRSRVRGGRPLTPGKCLFVSPTFLLTRQSPYGSLS
jgi:hypothetical protein